MKEHNGNGAKAPLAGKPALQDAMDRQERVLGALARPIPRESVAAWKDELVRAAVGRVSDGMRSLLADPEMTVLIESYLVEDTLQAEEFRRMFRETLAVEFAFPLEDLSRLAHEELRTGGVARAEMTRQYGATEYR